MSSKGDRGGRRNSWGGGGGGGGNPIDTQDLISARERKQAEVDQVLNVLRDYNREYGIQVDTEIGIFPVGETAMGYYDPSTGNIGMNKAYFNATKLDAVMDEQAKSGAHPPRGNKTGIEAVMSHEAGHKINYALADKHGMTADKFADTVIEESAKKMRYKNSANMAAKISSYAKTDKKEAIAEAFADVYCNGKDAKRESRTIVNTVRRYL